jgi:drug/metabolite transporter (DMT)-like permease
LSEVIGSTGILLHDARMPMTESKRGCMFLFFTVILEGLAPVLLHSGSVIFPPALFLFLGISIAACALFVLLLITGGVRQRLPWSGVRNVMGVAVFIIGGFTLVLFGSRHSSGINTALLTQAEIVWTLLLSSIVLRDRITARHLLGACVILLGTLVVLWQGSFAIGRGDLLIVGATVLFPFGNAFAKRALREMPPLMVLFLRYLFGMLLLLPLTLLLGDWSVSIPWDRQHVVVLLVFALLILTASKVCWYEGLRRHSLHLSVSAITATPALSLVFAFFFLQEIPTLSQWIGFVLTVGGIGILFRSDADPSQIATG